MERNRLIELAPQYYMLGICDFLGQGIFNEVASSNTLWDQCEGVGRSERSSWVFWKTLEILVERRMVEQITDDFGPPLYKRTEQFTPAWEAMKKVAGSPASKFAIDPNRKSWLSTALENVNKACLEHKLISEDFKNPDAEWEPIPVDRTSSEFKKVTDTLDETIKAVEQDNGYNATLPEEKAFVVDNLKDAAQRLKKEDAISYAYLKRKAIDVLDVLIRRFGGASVGLAAQAARAAIFDWLKEAAGKALHWLF
jgi:hypothetical protein